MVYSSKSFPRETSEETSEETSSGANQFFSEKRDVAISLEEKKVDDDNLTTEVPEEELAAEGPTPIFEFLDKFKLEKFNLNVRH